MHVRRLLAGLSLAVAVAAASTEAAGRSLPVRSTFDAGPEGWTYNVSVEWRETGGNPGGMLYGPIDEETNASAAGDAAAKFLGDWSGLDGVGVISFDYRKFSHGGGTILAYYPVTIVLTGPGGSATWTGVTPTAPTGWFAVGAPLRAGNWSVNSGTWAELLANVTQMRIPIELESSTQGPDDKAGLDNVTLGYLGDANWDGRVDADDYVLIDRGRAVGLAGWGNGDFNSDGVVREADYAIVDEVYVRLGGGGGDGGGGGAGTGGGGGCARIDPPAAVAEACRGGCCGGGRGTDGNAHGLE